MWNKLRDMSSKPEAFQVELKFTGRFKDTAAQLFSSGDAILEFLDNVVAARDTIDGRTQITVGVSANGVRVAGYEENGMDRDDFERFTKAGDSSDRDLSMKGVGAKFAAFTLGRSLKIVAKKSGGSPGWKFEDPNFGSSQVDYSGKRWVLPIEPGEIYDAYSKTGLVIVEVKDMKWDKPPQRAQIINEIREVYQEILEPKTVKFGPSGWSRHQGTQRQVVLKNGQIGKVQDRVTVYVGGERGRTIQVKPREVKLAQDSGLNVVLTNRGEAVGLRVGRIDRSVRSGYEGGGRLYYAGRQVAKKEFFGIESSDSRVRSELFAQVFLDNVEGIREELQMNKSKGVRVEGSAWKRVLEAVKPEIENVVKEIVKQKDDSEPISDRMIVEGLQLGTTLADAALRKLLTDGVIGEGDIEGQTRGGSKGQLHPNRMGETRESGNFGIKGKPWTDQEGRSLRNVDADYKIPRRRLSPYTSVEWRSLGTDVRSQVETDSSGGRNLILNSDQPLNLLQKIAAVLFDRNGVIFISILAAEMHIKEVAQGMAKGDGELARMIEDQALGILGQSLAGRVEFQSLQTQALAKMVLNESERAVKSKRRKR